MLPISVLKDTAIGIEAHYYLQKALALQLKEPLVSALGGFPFGLKQMIQNDIRELRENSIKPVFVFSGLQMVPTEKPFSVPDDSAKLRTRAWELYDKGQAVEAVDMFGQAGVITVVELFRIVMRILRDEKVDFQVSPYASWPQLAYLEKTGYVDSIYGGSDLFLFDVEKVIVNFNLGTGHFYWVNKARLRSDLLLTNDHFVDAILLSGCSFCRPFPPLENSQQQFSDAVALIKRNRSVGNAINSHPDQTEYLDKFRKARAAIKHHPVMTEDGKVEQMNFHESPADVQDFIGLRLPEELYFYLSRGMIGSQVMDMITTGEYIQSPPLDGNESDEYKKFLNELNVMRTESLSLLSKSIHRLWFTRTLPTHRRLHRSGMCGRMCGDQ
ncbi:PIN domain-like protein [Tricharina praecox]|uniref:PIN domain-like protein n=1 Tax=Tricharina praecox TaxID=43433 RepID=UPI0022211C5E|nr:PIN domain-like protein [Tricharina praecox]KAI5842872.1 PIN domain-like protein [Tricharina praecox]